MSTNNLPRSLRLNQAFIHSPNSLIKLSNFINNALGDNRPTKNLNKKNTSSNNKTNNYQLMNGKSEQPKGSKKNSTTLEGKSISNPIIKTEFWYNLTHRGINGEDFIVTCKKCSKDEMFDPKFGESPSKICPNCSFSGDNIIQSFQKIETDYFLNREVLVKGRRLKYKNVVDMYLASIKKQGVNIEGPTCEQRYDNYLIRYITKGTSNTGKIWDHNIDFEVNSKINLCKPLSKLANILNGFVDN